MRIQFIKPGEIDVYLSRGAQFIDLRDAEEYREKHIKGAISMPYEQFEMQYKGLPKSRTYVLYCDRGATSMLAVKKMLAEGYEAWSLSGGMEAAKKQSGDVEKS